MFGVIWITMLTLQNRSLGNIEAISCFGGGLHYMSALVIILCSFPFLFNSLSASHSNWCTVTLLNRIITAQWEGMGDVGSERHEPALLPPCPTIRVLCYSNCQRSTHSHQPGRAFDSTLSLYSLSLSLSLFPEEIKMYQRSENIKVQQMSNFVDYVIKSNVSPFWWNHLPSLTMMYYFDSYLSGYHHYWSLLSTSLSDTFLITSHFSLPL